jgi:hypothetical protein
MKISFAAPDMAMPRTVYYDQFAEAVRRNPRFVTHSAEADICFPAEDISLETNWPRFGEQASAFVRGGLDWNRFNAYADVLLASRTGLCIVNMHPFVRWPQLMASRGDVFVADVSLPNWERLLNPRTISMPALPITVGPGVVTPKTVLASFRGTASHPCREKLRAIHDGAAIRCEFVDRSNHVGRIDAMSGKADGAYLEMLAASTFAFVPRGDALFSYRFLEAMSFGCIPVILSDNWVLPFDRTVRWTEIALHPTENDIPALPRSLRAFSPERIAAIQRGVIKSFRDHFSSLDAIVETLLREIELLRVVDESTASSRNAMSLVQQNTLPGQTMQQPRNASFPPRSAAPEIPVSWGELIDKVTILEIKSGKLERVDSLKNVRRELALLQSLAAPILAAVGDIADLQLQLKDLNEKLWHVENRIREKEANDEFDAEFIELARCTYKTNDERSALKKTINERLGSSIVEEKSYSLAEYHAPERYRRR